MKNLNNMRRMAVQKINGV